MLLLHDFGFSVQASVIICGSSDKTRHFSFSRLFSVLMSDQEREKNMNEQTLHGGQG